MAEKKPPHRPLKMTPDTIQKLETAFLMGCTDMEACFAAGITKPTLYKYCDKNPGYTERKETLKKRPVYLARGVIVDALIDHDVHTAHKVLERHDGTKAVLAGDANNPLRISASIVAAELDEVEASRLYKEMLHQEK